MTKGIIYMKKQLGVLCIIILFGWLVACQEISPDDNSQANDINNEENHQETNIVNDDEGTSNNDEEVDSEEIEYDELQQLYVNINDETTYEEVIDLIEKFNLPYNEEEFSSGPSIKVAFDDGVTKFKHADSGDYVEISFNEDLMIDTVEYFNNDIFITLFDYRDGTYWEFRDQPEYAGYYINTYNDKAGDFTIKYKNGNESETDYLKVDSKEEQFKYMMQYKHSKE